MMKNNKTADVVTDYYGHVDIQLVLGMTLHCIHTECYYYKAKQ